MNEQKEGRCVAEHLEETTIHVPLHYAPDGQYVIGDGFHQVRFAIDKRPNCINRFFCKWFLGWKWIDNKIQKS